MPTKAYPFGEWTPDLADNVLTKAENVVPIGNGYAPVSGPQAVTVALPGTGFFGGGAFIDSTGDSTLLAGGSGGLNKYTGTAWTNIDANAPVQALRLAQFGDNILYCGSAQPVKSYSLTGGTVSTPTAAPHLIDVAQVRDFVMGITTDNAAQWCQFNNSADWTTGVNQADKQPSLWGQLKRIVGGEYAVLLTDSQVIRGTYVGVESGLDIIWQFDQISQEIGCMAGGSVAAVGRLIFFLSERGFMMCDGNEVTPIAEEKFNRFFFGMFSRPDIADISTAIDPRNSLVVWAMPGSPGLIVAYNWALKRGTTWRLNVNGLMSGYTAGVSLDALDATYGNLDAIPISLDDPSLQGGSPLLLLADGSNVLNTLSGPNLQATLKLDDIEPAPGARSRIRGIRLVSDTTSASATLDSRMRAGDSESIVDTSAMRANGKMPIRANGRYNTLEVTIPAGTDWSFVQGCELEFEIGDGR